LDKTALCKLKTINKIKFLKTKIMKRIVIFSVIAFISQTFCVDGFGQNNSVNDQFDIVNSNVTLRLSSQLQWSNPVEYFAGMTTVEQKGLGFGINQQVSMYIGTNGNVGIGGLLRLPAEKLTVDGNIKINNGKLLINIDPDSINATVKGKFSAFITGGILSEDYAISPKSGWADHVFNADYRLQDLDEVESFINTNKHLPGIPSATEVQENGYTVHDMNVKLLQKVEELTLYTIEQNKEIEQLKKVVTSYQSLLEKVEKLENKINQ
jgi:hypothetical protein